MLDAQTRGQTLPSWGMATLDSHERIRRVEDSKVTEARKVHVDWTSLEGAFENHSPDARSYLHRLTGEVFTIIGDDEGDALALRVQAAPEEYLRIEPIPSREQYRMMEKFIATVIHTELKERLQDSIVGKGAFRRFKDVVTQYSDERKRWFTFRDVLAHQYIMDWLKANKVESEEPAPWNLDLPAEPAATTTGTPAPAPEPEEPRPETGDLKRYMQAWVRSHGEEYGYLFGPAAFDRLVEDMSGEFTFFRRR